jgi:hypothetical protein
MQHNLPATEAGRDAYALLPLHGTLLKDFTLLVQTIALYGKFRNTAPFCDDDYTLFSSG